jgi:hypothetical protein
MVSLGRALLIVCACLPCLVAQAQAAAPQTAAQNRASAQVAGVVSAAADGRPLPGVVVKALTEAGTVAGEALTDGDGRYAIALPPGAYRIEVDLDGFEPTSAAVTLSANGRVERAIVVALKPLAERVDVSGAVPTDRVDQNTQALAATLLDRAPLRSDSILALFPLLPGVVRAPDGRLRMSGGLPSQTGLQISSASVADPSTGELAFEPPGDAVESVQFLPNPYSAEYGRFSTGLAEIRTRPGSENWRFAINGMLPRPRVAPGNIFKIIGLESFVPRATIGGPLNKDNQWFLAQSVQFRRVNTEVQIPGRPLISLQSFDSYTRLDGKNVGGGHLTAALAFFPRRVDGLLLNAFVPSESTAHFSQRGFNAGVSYSKATPKIIANFLANVKRYDADVEGHGADPSRLAPSGVSGSYFNDQTRRTFSVQIAQSIARGFSGPTGDHVLRVGADLFASRYRGTSISRPVEVYRADGSLAERLAFSPASRQNVSGVDLSAFVQDEWRAGRRLTLEGGLRIDRDGTLRRTHAAARSAAALNLRVDGGTVLRGGAGLFFQRTPLNVGAFQMFERPAVTIFNRAGEILESRALGHDLASLDTPRSVIWNIELDHELTQALMVKVNYLQRRGREETLVTPSASALVLSGGGRSSYRQGELTFRYATKKTGELLFTYLRALSEADLNAYDNFFGNLRTPIVRPNAYSLTSTDVPNRFLVRGTVLLPRGYEALPVLEIRDGFPYSFIDERQLFVGERNRAGRFPRVVTVDFAVQKRIVVRRLKPRVGIRLFNVFGRFTPRDIQNNIHAADFGTFYNTVPRRIALTLQFDR